MKHKIHSFMLVELIVVVIVLGVLSGMLMTLWINKAGSASAAATCLGNLKKFGVALASYADENEGFTPEARTGSASSRNWFKLLSGNLEPLPGMKDWNNPGMVKGEFGIFRCPENREQIYLAAFHGANSNRSQSYGANAYSGLNENRFMGTAVDSFKYPSQLAALFESNYGRCAVWAPENKEAPENVSEPRHEGKMTILFADGHAAFNEGSLKSRGKQIGKIGNTADAYENGKLWYAK